MELTLDSAFSPGGLVGHLAYVLLIISMMMRNITWLRILVIASAIVAIVYDGVWLKDPIGVFWETGLVLVNIYQLFYLYWKNIRARFTEHELEFKADKMPSLGKGKCREFLNRGKWSVAPVGSVLTRQDKKVKHLHYIAKGLVDIHVNQKRVNTCGPGNFIGEITILSQDNATATAIVTQEANLWSIDADTLGALLGKDEDIRIELEAAFARHYRQKLIQTNLRVTEEL